MLTKPSSFSEYNERLDAERHWVVELTDGTDTWYFSDVAMELSEGFVYDLLLGQPTYATKADVMTKRWSPGDLRFSLSNVPFGLDSSFERQRVSDLVEDVIAKTVKLYAIAGPTASSLASDAMQVFEGTVLKVPVYTSQRVDFDAVEPSVYINASLATTLMGDEHSDCPVDIQTKPEPILYGKWTHTYDTNSPYAGHGLAIAYRLSEGDNPKYLAAKHECDEITELAFPISKTSGDVPFFAQSVTGNANDTDGATIQWDFETSGPDDGRYALMYRCYLSTSLSGRYDGEVAIGANAVDGNTGTHATIDDFNYDDGSLIYGYGDAAPVNAEMLARMWAGIRYDGDPIEAYVRYYELESVIAGATVGFTILIGDTSTDNWSVEFDAPTMDSASWKWVGPLTHSDATTGDEERHWPLMLRVEAEHTSAGDGTTNNQDIVNVHEIEMYFRAPVSIPPSIGYVAADGRKYGSWIDSRSSNYSSGDVIEDPAGIVESILRDELSLTNSDIDMPSFIAAEDTNYKARINITKREEAFKIIRQILEQSSFAFHFSALGTARAIPLDVSSPTTDATIPLAHINNLRVGKTDVIGSYLRYRTDYLPEQNEFQTEGNHANSTATTKYGVIRYEADWPNIDSDTADYLKTHLFGPTANPTPGLYNAPKTFIEVETIGMTHIDIEVGDWIEINDEDADPHVKLWGSSWSGNKFLVTEIYNSGDTYTIKAIDINEGYT